MFTFDPDYTFHWPVTVQMPEAGASRPAEFTALFRLVEEDELFARRGGDATPAMSDLLAGERAALAERLLGWDGIETPDGTPLPFSPENRERLLRQRPIREAVAKAYFDAVLRGGVAEKN